MDKAGIVLWKLNLLPIKINVINKNVINNWIVGNRKANIQTKPFIPLFQSLLQSQPPLLDQLEMTHCENPWFAGKRGWELINSRSCKRLKSDSSCNRSNSVKQWMRSEGWRWDQWTVLAGAGSSLVITLLLAEQRKIYLLGFCKPWWSLSVPVYFSRILASQGKVNCKRSFISWNVDSPAQQSYGAISLSCAKTHQTPWAERLQIPKQGYATSYAVFRP